MNDVYCGKSHKQMLGRFTKAISCGLFLWACASNPPDNLKTLCENSIASADQLVVSTGGMAFARETFRLQGAQKDRFADEIGRLLSVDYQGFFWAEHIAVARPWFMIYTLQDSQCENVFVVEKSLHNRGGDAINKVIEQLRLIAREGQSVPVGFEPVCQQKRQRGIFFWFGMPWDYEYVLRL